MRGQFTASSMLVVVWAGWLAVGCGGKAHDTGARNATGAAGAADTPVARLCSGTLEVPGQFTRELDCDAGVQAIGGGLFRLNLTDAEGDSVVLSLPSLDSGFYGSLDCANGSISLAAGGTYLGDQLTFPDAVVAAHLKRDDSGLGLEVGGQFCDYVADAGSGMPGPQCISASISGVHAPIALEERSCDCGLGAVKGNYCLIPSCATGSCTSEQCPVQAALCRAR